MPDSTAPVAKPTETYYFIKPSVSVAGIGSALAIIIIGLLFLFTFISTAFKWENRKCKGANFLLSSAINGKKVEDTFGECVQKAQTNSTSNDDSALTKLTTDLKTSVDTLQSKIIAAGPSPSTSASYTGLLSTVDTIQSALSKVLGSVVLTAKMNNGVLQSSNSLQNGELSQLINKYNTLGSNIQEQQATSAAAGIS